MKIRPMPITESVVWIWVDEQGNKTTTETHRRLLFANNFVWVNVVFTFFRIAPPHGVLELCIYILNTALSDNLSNSLVVSQDFKTPLNPQTPQKNAQWRMTNHIWRQSFSLHWRLSL